VKRFIIPVVALLGALAMVLRIESGEDHVTRPDIVLDVSAGNVRIPESELLDSYLIGSDLVSRDGAVDAMCVNDDMFARDVTLRTVIAVGSSQRLVRVAELVDGGRFEPDFVRGVEEAILPDGSADPIAITDAAGLDVDRVQAYLDAADEDPSDEARRRFVAFAVNVKLRDVTVFFVDREGIDWQDLRLDRGSNYETYVPGDDGWSDLGVGPDQCVGR
jgi:hypothetical protein